MSSTDFYSRVARKFGGYRSGVEHVTEYRTVDPEVLFVTLVQALGGPTRWLLDAGCADGRNILHLAPTYGTVYAIDLSAEMLAVAEENRRASGLTHIHRLIVMSPLPKLNAAFTLSGTACSFMCRSQPRRLYEGRFT